MDTTPDDAQQLLSLLPEDGTARGNGRLRGEVGWEPERYWAARDLLLRRRAAALAGTRDARAAGRPLVAALGAGADGAQHV